MTCYMRISSRTQVFSSRQSDTDTLAGIKSIVAVPEPAWRLDYITPRPYCLRRDGKCSPGIFSGAVDSKKVQISYYLYGKK